MRRQIICLMTALLTFVIGAGTVALINSFSPHASDSELIRNFYEHETDFDLLVKMAKEDSRADVIDTSFACVKVPGDLSTEIYVYENQPWTVTESDLGFTKQRWNDYRALFVKAKLEYGMDHKHDFPDAVFFTASMNFSDIDSNETAVTEKGYVYSPQSINDSLIDSLDGIEIDRPAIFFKRLNDNWYLYYEWSVAKPE